MAYNSKGIDSNDILRQKASSMEALSSAKKSSESTRKMFGGFSTKIAGDSKARANKLALMKEQEVQYQILARSDRSSDNLDPYSFPTQAKLRATEKLALREQGYTNSLLTQIIKNQTNTANLQAEIQYRDSVLNLLKEIRDNTKREEKKATNLGPNKGYETKVRKSSDLAEAILGGNPKEMLKQLLKGTELGSLGFEGLDMLKDSLDMMKEPGMIKQMMKGKIMESIIGKLPKDIASHLTRMREDMGTYVQDMINQFAYSKNSTLRAMTKGHYKSVKQDSSSVGKTDMTKEALFDNKFYTAVTMEIPSILYSIRDGINKFVGERYDYDKQEWTTLQAQIRDMAESSQSMTTGVDQLVRHLSNVSEKAMSNTGGITNSYMGQLFQTDKYGAYSKDKGGKLQFQNETLVRQILTAMIKKGIDTNALQDVNPNALINDFGIRNFVAKEYHSILPNIILGMSDVFKNLSYEERKEFDERREGVVNSVDRNYLNNLNKITGYSPQYIDAIYRFQKGMISAQDFEQMTGMGISRGTKLSGASKASIGHKVSMGATRAMNKVKKISSVQDVNNILSSPIPSIEALSNIPASVWKDLSDDTRATVNSLIGRSTFGMTSSRMVDSLLTNDISSNMKTMTAEQREATLKQQRLDNIKIMINNGGITDKGLRDRYYNDKLTAEDNAKLDKELTKYFKANEIFTKMHNANMTAASMAHYVGMGAKASDYERLGFVSDPAQLVPFINEKGELQINQLKAKYSKYNEAMMLGIEKEDRRVRMGDDFEISTPITSINRMLTNVFQDAKVTRNMGILGGAGAGYAIGKLLEQKGIIQSPWLGKMMATVGAVAMSFAKNREKIENILGPAGEFKNEHGVTNRQIFMAKFINKWLPSIGLGGKVGSMTMKAFQAMGPLGTLISPFAGLMTGLIAGSVAPSLLRFAQRRLFDDNDESKKGIFKRVGRFLMKFDFVKKYFNIRDKRTNRQIENEIVGDMIRNLERHSEQLIEKMNSPDTPEDERVEIGKQIAENTKRIEELRELGRDLADIEENARATEAEKEAERKKRKAMLSEKNRDAYNLREETERNKRDLSQSGIAMHDMKFMTKADMYKQSRDATISRLKADVNSEANQRAKVFAEGYSSYLSGNIDGVKDPELLEILDRFKKGGHNLSDKKIEELIRRFYVDRMRNKGLQEVDDMDMFIQNEIIDPKTGKPLNGRDVIFKFGKPYLEAALAKHNYERAIKNGKVLLPSEIVRSSDMAEFNKIMQNSELTPEQKEKAIKAWFENLDEDKRNGLNDAMKLRRDISGGLDELSKTYIRYLTFMNPEMKIDAIMRKAMYDIQATVALNDFKTDLGNIKGITGDAWDRLIYEKFQSGYIVNDSRSRGESEQLISTLMNMHKSEVTGGAGSDKETTQDTQASWRMSDFKDLTFKNGRKVSAAGCALGAFNAAITRFGYPPISAQAMLDVANEYVTDDGINMEFFKAMAVKIGWEVTQYKGSENKFTPQNFKSITTGAKSSVILQLQNLDNDGSHYVTLLQYGAKKCQICDPQAQVYKTEILTGDILTRLVSATVLTHPGDETLKADTDMSKVDKFKKKIKDRAKDAVKNTLKSNGIGMAVYGLYKLGQYAKNRNSGGGLVPTNGNTNADGTSQDGTETTKTEDPVVSKLQAILDKLHDYVNVRIIGDDTIALTNTDLESSKTALQMSLQDAKTPKDKNRLHHIRQMFNKPSFQRDQIKKEKVEDAILQNAAITSSLLAKSGKNSANGTAAGTGENTAQGPDGPKVPGGKTALGALASIASGVAPYVLGAATSAYIWKDELQESYLDITGVNQSTDPIYDENGNLVEAGYIADDASKWGTLGKDYLRTAKYASKVWKWIISFMGKIATKLLSLGGRSPLIKKICSFLTGGLLKAIKATPISTAASNISKFAKMAGKLLPVLGLISEMFLSYLSFKEGKRLAREFLQLPSDIEVPEELAKEVAFANFLYNNLFGLIAGVVGLIPGPGTAAAAVILAIGEMVMHKFYPKSNFFKFFAELNGIPYGIKIGGFIKDKTKGEIIAVDMHGAPIPNMRYKIKKSYNEDGQLVNKLGKTKEEYVKDKMYNMNKDYRYSDEWIKFASDNADLSDKEFSKKAASIKMKLYDDGYDTTGDRKYERNSIYLQRMKDNAYSKYSSEWEDEVGDGPSGPSAIQIKKITDKFRYGTYDEANKRLGIVDSSASGLGSGTFGLTMGQGSGLQGDFSTITGGDSNPIAIISKVAKITGVDENLMMAIAGKESGFQADAGARGSSAKGLFQFTSDTWKDVTKKYASKIGLTPAEMQRGMGTANDPRFNPYMNTFMAAYHLVDEYNTAKKYAGRDPLPEEVYMVHAFGVSGSRKFIQASKDAIGIQLETSQNVINSNPYFFYEGGQKRIRPFTVGEMYSWFRKGLESGLAVKNKKAGSNITYAGAFGVKTAANQIYEPSKILPEIKMGESIGKTYAGIMDNMPIKGTKKDVVVTSAFGPRNVKGGSKNHKGIDIRAYKGTPIYATHSGKITSNTSNFGIVQITDNKGMSTRYLHLSRRTPLKVGDFVKAGQQIGEAGGVGPNGRADAYGSHLHYEVIDSSGNKIDPFKVLELSYSNLKSSERENINYAIRNGLVGKGIKTAMSNIDMTPVSKLEKGDGPVNQDSSSKPIPSAGFEEKMISAIVKAMGQMFSGVMQQQAKTTEVLTNILSFLQSETRDNFLINNARMIAKSKY